LETSDEFVAHNIQILTLDGGRIGVLTAFRDPALFAKFGLPPVLPATPSAARRLGMPGRNE